MSLVSGRIILAAAKLALFYIALVILGIVALDVALRAGAPPWDILVEMGAWLSIPFGGAFLLLALARRWGFVALWALLGAFWVFLAFVSGSWQSPNAFPQLFVPWSIFALPLWLAWLRAPIPLILSAFAIRHVWRGTAKPIAA
jgi:hypothetical protein